MIVYRVPVFTQRLDTKSEIATHVSVRTKFDGV